MSKYTVIMSALFLTLLMIVTSPANAQPLDKSKGQYAYGTEEEKAAFEKKYLEATGKEYRLPGVRSQADLILLEGNTLIPVDISDGKHHRLNTYAVVIDTKEASTLSPAKVSPPYTAGPDIDDVFLREEADVFNRDKTYRFSDHEWSVVPGLVGIDLAEERKAHLDRGLEMPEPVGGAAVFDNFDSMRNRYSAYRVPTTADAKKLEKAIVDDRAVTPSEVALLPEGFYAALRSENPFCDSLTWDDFDGARLIIISHGKPAKRDEPQQEDTAQGRSTREGSGASGEEAERREGGSKTERATGNGPSTPLPATQEQRRGGGDVVTTITITNTKTNVTYNYGRTDSAAAPAKAAAAPDTTEEEPLGRPTVMIEGMYGSTVQDGDPRGVVSAQVAVFPFSDDGSWLGRVGIGFTYESGSYYNARETGHFLGEDGYEGVSLTERKNAGFNGYHGSLHFIPPIGAQERLVLDLSIGYRSYGAEEYAIGRMYDGQGDLVEEEDNWITDLEKDMFLVGGGVTVLANDWLNVGANIKFGKSSEGWDYGIDGMPAEFSGADKKMMLKSVSFKLGVHF